MAIRFTVLPPSPASRPSVIAFDLERIVLGRGSVCDLRIPHASVSSHHATITLDGGGYAIMDEGSTNGTRLNGTPIPQMCRQPLRSDDVIEIAGYRIVPSLAVALEEGGGGDRTDALARALISGAADGEEAPLEITDGPVLGSTLSFPASQGRSIKVGCEGDCDLRLSDPRLAGLKLEFRPDPAGWTLVVTGGGGSQLRSARLSDGKIISVGGTRIRFRDPVDARLTEILETRDDLQMEPRPGQEPGSPGTAGGKARQSRDAEGPGDPRPRPPSRKAPPDQPPALSREERRSQIEYGWMVIALGIVAFLASLALLLLLMF